MKVSEDQGLRAKKQLKESEKNYNKLLPQMRNLIMD